ncbi:MAG TPA: GAF domain-containing protein, partial [Dehalococcoidia bacterium]
LVDDQVMLRDALRLHLEDEGYRVFAASSAAEALAIAQAEPVDLVVTDLVMPERDGMWLLRELGRVRPSAKVIMMTGFGSADSAVEALHAGAFDYLEKPVDSDRLKAKLRKALRVKRLEELRQRAEDESIRRTRELSALYAISQTLTQSLEIGEILEISLRKVLEVMDLPAAAVLLLDEQRQYLDLACAVGLKSTALKRIQRVDAYQGSLGRVMAERDHYLVPDLQHTASRLAHLFDGRRYQSCLIVPLCQRDQAIGILGVLSGRGRILGEDDLHLLSSISNQLGAAIGNAQLFERQRRQAEQLRLIHRVGREILSSLEEQETLDMILHGATQTLPVDKAAVVYRDEGDGRYTVVAALHMAGETVRALQEDVEEWMAAWTPEWRRRDLNPISAQEADGPAGIPDALVREGVRSLLAVPLVLDGEVAGVLVLCNCNAAAAFRQDDRSIATIYADLASVAIRNSRTFAGVERRRYQEQAALLDLSTQLLGTLDPDRVAEIVCGWVAGATGADGVLVLLAEPGTDRVQVRARHGWAEDAVRGGFSPGDGSMVGFALAQKTAVLCPDLTEETRWQGAKELLAGGARSVMAAPFLLEDQALGVLVVSFRQRRTFTEDDARRFLLFADRAAAAVHQAFLHQRVRQREEELARVNADLRAAYAQLHRHATVIEQANALTAVSASSLDIDRLYRNVAEYALGITQSCLAMVVARTADGAERSVTAGPDRLPPDFPYREVLNAVCRTRAPVWWPLEEAPDRELPLALAVPLLDGAEVRGMLMALAKEGTSFTDEDARLLQTLANQATLAERTIRLYEDLEETYDATLEALVAALDARDRETENHSQRVAALSLAIARELGIEEGSQQWVDTYRGAVLHDVGKIGVADAILRKPEKLSPSEWAEMRRHPEYAYHMLKDVKFLAGALEVVYAHHERYDGKGYPRGLKGEEIPLGSRIFAVADAFDAMTSDRPYRKAMPWDAALREIRKHTGTQFDPKVVEAFEAVYRKAMSGEIQVPPFASRRRGAA